MHLFFGGVVRGVIRCLTQKLHNKCTIVVGYLCLYLCIIRLYCMVFTSRTNNSGQSIFSCDAARFFKRAKVLKHVTDGCLELVARVSPCLNFLWALGLTSENWTCSSANMRTRGAVDGKKSKPCWSWEKTENRLQPQHQLWSSSIQQFGMSWQMEETTWATDI